MHAIGSSLPYAVAIALSAPPILALVVVMVTIRPVKVPAMFLLGWTTGILLVAGVLVGLVDLSVGPRLPATVGTIVLIVGGVAVGVLALRSWRQRSGARDVPPKWLASITRWSESRALRVGFTLGSVNPKNVVLVAAGAAAMLEASTAPGELTIAVMVFAVVSSLGVATPILLREFGGSRMNSGLERAAQWMTVHSKSLSTAVLIIIAIVMLGNGLGRLIG